MSRIFKRGDKYWIDYTDASGKRVRKPAAKDKSAAGQLLRDMLVLEAHKKALSTSSRAAKAKRNVKSECVCLSDIWDAYEGAPENIRKLRPRTIEIYRSDFTDVLRDGELSVLDDVSDAAVRGLQDTYLTRGLSNRSVNRKIATLKLVLNWAAMTDIIAENPIKKIRPLAKCPVNPRRDFSQSEIEALLDTVPEKRYPLWLLLASTGMRSNEICQMFYGHISFEKSEVTIPASVAKNKTARMVPIPADTLDWIKRNKRQPKDRVFTTEDGNPLTKTRLYRWLLSDIKRAGIEKKNELGKVDVHSFRNTAISRMLEGGIDLKRVMDIVGHTSMSMTLDVYARVSAQAKHDAVNGLSFVKRGRKPQIVELKKSTG